MSAPTSFTSSSSSDSEDNVIELPSPLEERYTAGGQLGKGGQAKVYKIFDLRCQTPYACRVTTVNARATKERQEMQRKSMQDEIAILSSIDHPHLIKFHEYYRDESAEISYQVLEYCDGGDMFDLLYSRMHRDEHLSEKDIKAYLVQMLRGASYMHNDAGEAGRAPIVHRDLKVENLLLKRGKLVIGDLGLAKQIQPRSRISEKLGPRTHPCWAPEICAGNSYDTAIDVWAIGCIVFQLATFEVPFDEGVRTAGFPDYSSPAITEGDYSDDLTSLLKRILVKKAAWRPTCAQVLEAPELVIAGEQVDNLVQRIELEDTKRMILEQQAENDRVKAENARVKAENNRVKAENAGLRKMLEKAGKLPDPIKRELSTCEEVKEHKRPKVNEEQAVEGMLNL